MTLLRASKLVRLEKVLFPFARALYLQNLTTLQTQSARSFGGRQREREAFNLRHCCVHTSLTADSESSPLSAAPRTMNKLCKSAIEILALFYLLCWRGRNFKANVCNWLGWCVRRLHNHRMLGVKIVSPQSQTKAKLLIYELGVCCCLTISKIGLTKHGHDLWKLISDFHYILKFGIINMANWKWWNLNPNKYF